MLDSRFQLRLGRPALRWLEHTLDERQITLAALTVSVLVEPSFAKNRTCQPC